MAIGEILYDDELPPPRRLQFSDEGRRKLLLSICARGEECRDPSPSKVEVTGVAIEQVSRTPAERGTVFREAVRLDCTATNVCHQRSEGPCSTNSLRVIRWFRPGDGQFPEVRGEIEALAYQPVVDPAHGTGRPIVRRIE